MSSFLLIKYEQSIYKHITYIAQSDKVCLLMVLRGGEEKGFAKGVAYRRKPGFFPTHTSRCTRLMEMRLKSPAEAMPGLPEALVNTIQI
jgi:hypothetical protein